MGDVTMEHCQFDPNEPSTFSSRRCLGTSLRKPLVRWRVTAQFLSRPLHGMAGAQVYGAGARKCAPTSGVCIQLDRRAK
jgi:hypothetical protein